MTIRSFHRARARRLDRAARRTHLLARRGRLLAGATLGATALLASNAQAASYTVTTTNDSNDGSCTVGLCSLRDAVNAANADSSSDTITFASGLTGQIDLTGGALPITTNHGLTINGPGAGSLSVSGQGNSQIFKVTSSGGGPPGSQSANVIRGLTLTDGSTSAPGGAVSDLSFEPLVLIDDAINHSRSTNSDNDGGGGGVFAEGPLEIVASTISGNTAAHGGGVEINPKYASSTEPKYALPVLIKDSTISNNHATGTSGASASPFGGGGGVAAYGGQMVVRDSTVSGNTSIRSGGGITDLSKYGMTISGSKLNRNTATEAGGAVMDEGFIAGRKYGPTEISTSTISGNTAHSGAGLAFAQYGINTYTDVTPPGQPITIEASTISGNRGTDNAPHPGSARSFGGGIEVFGTLGSPFRLVNSTVSGNAADRGGGISLGGAYYQPLVSTDPSTGQTGSVSLENSTIAGNQANLATGGGGIYLGRYKPSPSSAVEAGTAAIESTIVSGNKANGQPNDLRRAQLATTGGFTGDFSLIQHPGVAPLTGNQLILNRKPGLGPLQNNGGPTETKLPWPKSPVIDQGHAMLGATGDQRGQPRTVDTGVPNPPGGDGTDIGAVELSSGQVKVAADPGFSADVGKQRFGGASTPVLVDGATPVSCRVTIGPLGSCQLEVTVQGQLVAAGGVSSVGSAKRLSTTVNSSAAAQRYLLKHYPLGLVASARASGLATGPASALGKVRLLGGPSITLQLGTAAARFSRRVNAELDQAAALLGGTRRVTVTGASSSQAGAVARRLSKDRVRAPIEVRVSRHSPARQITITFSY